MATANFNIDAEDGWTQVVPAAAAFVKIRSNTPKHAFYVTTSATAPAADVIGYKVHCEDFWVDVSSTDPYWVRVIENLPQETRFDVFYLL